MGNWKNNFIFIGRKTEMKGESAYKVVDVAAKKVKDRKGRRAPRKVVEALQSAGVVSFTCKNLDWRVVGADAQSLFERLRAAQPE